MTLERSIAAVEEAILENEKNSEGLAEALLPMQKELAAVHEQIARIIAAQASLTGKKVPGATNATNKRSATAKRAHRAERDEVKLLTLRHLAATEEGWDKEHRVRAVIGIGNTAMRQAAEELHQEGLLERRRTSEYMKGSFTRLDITALGRAHLSDREAKE